MLKTLTLPCFLYFLSKCSYFQIPFGHLVTLKVVVIPSLRTSALTHEGRDVIFGLPFTSQPTLRHDQKRGRDLVVDHQIS